jgi:hypothetical protein
MVGDHVPGALVVLGMGSFTAFGIGLALASVIVGGTLWVAMGIHYGYNLGSSLLGATFSLEIAGDPVVIGSSDWVPETGLIGVAVWTAFALLLLALYRERIAPGSQSWE